MNLRGLVRVPGAIALGILGLAVPVLLMDRAWPDAGEGKILGIFDTDPDTATTALAAIAGGAITSLTLVYSLILIVFTLAAGNLAPRLLQRFTGDRVNQITAGLFGGTFLYAVVILLHVKEETVPVISLALACVLMVLSVLQLIYFIHEVAQSVTIDSEVTKISRELEARLFGLLCNGEGDDAETDYQFSKADSVRAISAGYITEIDREGLIDLAIDGKSDIKLSGKTGDFLLPGQVAASFSTKIRDEDREGFEQRLRDAITLAPFRGSPQDAEFSITLMTEIALRALSPGVNDVFTAVTCVDRFTAAFAEAAKRGLRGRFWSHKRSEHFVEIPGLTFEGLLAASFRPIRQAASGNLVILEKLGEALVQLTDIADERFYEVIQSEARSLLETARNGGLITSDVASIESKMSPLNL